MFIFDINLIIKRTHCKDTTYYQISKYHHKKNVRSNTPDTSPCKNYFFLLAFPPFFIILLFPLVLQSVFFLPFVTAFFVVAMIIMFRFIIITPQRYKNLYHKNKSPAPPYREARDPQYSHTTYHSPHYYHTDVLSSSSCKAENSSLPYYASLSS